ncbi:MAG: diguanylate cyclase [Marinobacter sp.]|uniref:GGDEF domain-containing protein n=1 Tax=Marinobacter sp. TaxID=50741 RepID=UPI00299F01AD|nr:diguanylate cyclase [Marinobacter sp.]MDX1754586.1 diguanylate cyclase [Marinobacter sp.]
MQDDERPIQSITRDILRRIVFLASMFVLLVSVVQCWVQYRSEIERVDALVATLAGSHVPLLTVALWDIEPEAARRQVAMIAAHPEIGSVRLTTMTGMTFQVGLGDASGTADFVTPIPHPQGRMQPLGELSVAYNWQQVRRNILISVAMATAKLSLFILFISVVVYRVIVSRLKKPLRQIARYSQRLSPNRDNPPLKIQRPERPWRDEIDLVSEGFETLRGTIGRYSAERDKAMAALARERDQLEARVQERTAELEEHRRELIRMTRTDPLTGLANRRYFDDAKRLEERRARRQGTPISLVMIDVDYFKAYNDRYGHAKGDRCLVRLAQVMREHCRRAGELAVRLGGEEFALLLPGQRMQETQELAEKLRQTLYDANLVHEGSPIGRVSVSIGCATWEPGCELPLDEKLFDRLLSLADKRLYQAKHNGRNQVVAEDRTPAEVPW